MTLIAPAGSEVVLTVTGDVGTGGDVLPYATAKPSSLAVSPDGDAMTAVSLLFTMNIS